MAPRSLAISVEELFTCANTLETARTSSYRDVVLQFLDIGRSFRRRCRAAVKIAKVVLFLIGATVSLRAFVGESIVIVGIGEITFYWESLCVTRLRVFLHSA